MALVYKTAGYEVAGGLKIYTECARKVTTEPQVELKPQIFARFQRVRYEAYLNFQQDEDHWQPLFTGNDLDHQHRSKTQFFTYIKDAPLASSRLFLSFNSLLACSRSLL